MKPTVLLASLLAASPLFAASETEVAAADSQVLDAVTVIGHPEQARRLPGSITVLDAQELETSRVFTTSEALRKAAGLNVRDEEGFGLRPNIGVRGLNPTRSTKVLLLEDGIPLAYAPYGDNASYYHPPVDRFDGIEVLKGAAMNAYGPQTTGAVINYLTPAPPQAFVASALLAAGNRGYLNGHLALGGGGWRFDYVRKEGEGARDNIDSILDDVNLKGVFSAGAHRFILRANHYREDSQVTYSGLTQAEFVNLGPRYNPFKNDRFEASRSGLSLSDEWSLAGGAKLITHAYYSEFERDWWRQASTTTDGQCGAAFTTNRNNGVAVDPDTCNSVQGRLRDYYTAGLEPRLSLPWGEHEFSAGLRAHIEDQQRLQVNGTAPSARTGTLAESNQRKTDAYSAFISNRFSYGAFTLTPSLRVEDLHYERFNRLNGARGTASLTEVIPAFGASWDFSPTVTLFAGVHEGFAPPRTEDILQQSGSTVTAIDLDAEKSVNLEAGLRARPRTGLRVESTVFRNDFKRLIAVGSIAGGSTPLAVGEADFQGLELSLRADLGQMYSWASNPYFSLAQTVLNTAKSETPFRNVLTGAVVAGSAAGRRLPYAPRHLLTAAWGWNHPLGVDARLELQMIGRQFSDFAQTEAPSVNGQAGAIPSASIWNLSLNYRAPSNGLGLFLTGKNLTDKVYIADRTRGIQTGIPRLVQAGVEYRF